MQKFPVSGDISVFLAKQSLHGTNPGNCQDRGRFSVLTVKDTEPSPVLPGYIPDEQYNPLQNDCGSIRRMLIASINTTKAKL